MNDQRLLLYAFLHDIDAFLGPEKTAEFSAQLGQLFHEIKADTLLETGRQEFVDELKAIQEPSRLPELSHKLVSIFSKVSLNRDTVLPSQFFPRRILCFDDSFLSADDENLDYMRQKFLDEVRNIPPRDFFATYETLVALVEKYTAFFPTPHQECESVSLFDHLRLSAAMAICYRSDTTPFPYRIVSGETLGLDDFIYNIATPEGHKGQAKGLRGRSFYCLVLTHVISHFFLYKLQLPITNLLWAGGELFAFLAPNTNSATETILECKKAINRWFLREHDGRMFLGLAQVEATAKDLTEDYTATFKATFDQLQQANQRRFASLWEEDQLNTLLGPSALPAKNTEECKICQKDFPQSLRLDRWQKELEDDDDLPGRCPICQLQYKLGSFLPKVRYYVEICASAILTTQLENAKVLFLDFPFGGPHEPVFYWVFPRERRWNDESTSLQRLLQKQQHLFTIRLVSPNETDVFAKKELTQGFPLTPSFSFFPLANTVPFNPEATDPRRQVLDFQEIAEQSDGAKYLAALKMDVDNFTRVFTDGLQNGQAKTLAHRMTLSRAFSYFFLGYINTIARHYSLTIPDDTKIEDSSQLYTVFAGGDDLFLLGPWDTVVDVAQCIREDFIRYTANKSNLTISAGITYFKPTFPIRRFARLTSDALDEEAKGRKDALSLFGEVLYWDGDIEKNRRIERLPFAKLYEFAKNLKKLVVENRAGEEVSHSFLMALLTLKRTSLDQDRIDWKWKLPYLLAQAGITEATESEKGRLLSRLVGNDEWFRSLEVPLMWVLLKTRRD